MERALTSRKAAPSGPASGRTPTIVAWARLFLRQRPIRSPSFGDMTNPKAAGRVMRQREAEAVPPEAPVTPEDVLLLREIRDELRRRTPEILP